MRSLVLFLAILLAFPLPAAAEDAPLGQTTFVTLELQTLQSENDIVDINGTIVRLLHGPVGVYTFFYVDRNYAEALVGPLVAPMKWLAIGAGAGLEQWPTGSWRVGGMVWMGNKSLVSTTFVETGAIGFWARSEFAWRPAFLRHDDGEGMLGIGFLADTLAGVGPRFEVHLPHTPIRWWQAHLVDLDGEPSFATGLRFDM